MNNNEPLAQKNRSYDFRPPRGTIVETLVEAYYCGTVPAGTKLRVANTSNAGFRGIEFSGRIVGGDRDGEYIVGLSTGNIRRVR